MIDIKWGRGNCDDDDEAQMEIYVWRLIIRILMWPISRRSHTFNIMTATWTEHRFVLHSVSLVFLHNVPPLLITCSTFPVLMSVCLPSRRSMNNKWPTGRQPIDRSTINTKLDESSQNHVASSHPMTNCWEEGTHHHRRHWVLLPKFNGWIDRNST